ncbi:uncharacterized protein YbjT (DUF2867 family) [Halopolyspora algeriensis]|uniref:Uncharacterized protein YbjT (DUF2867 family) n=1 Tax=Halopolyspora algeriensis TaxID=1500506 RepID=A0A368VAA2_9ACTN|nr:SDR family oxidoreductase [Halopolyspora algeriensis]RCW37643.1 uncharacterized protein YbjT (DUF2867 family) [Halopolyspora algeriensis]TQM46238.1 uncharacterized protein YbjT (DUF2867 family) [Halopolyspora algeriensis]
MQPILVTGATGTLGRAVTSRLLASGTEVRALSRRTQPASQSVEWAVADLSEPPQASGDLDEVVRGTSAIVHCASNPLSRGEDIEAALNLIEAARRTGAPHLIYISIVGVDRVPLGYYRTKWTVERILENSDVPSTILRATQFHDLVLAAMRNLARPPVMAVPARIGCQPVDADDVAERLARIALGEPAGRVPDLGGPQILTTEELARLYLRASGKRRRVLPVPVPGKVSRGYREGGHLAPEHAHGRITFEQFLAGRLA